MCVETGPPNYDTCAVHEDCDSPDCVALKQPQSLEDYVAAYEHWKDHSHMSGCSHGA